MSYNLVNTLTKKIDDDQTGGALATGRAVAETFEKLLLKNKNKEYDELLKIIEEFAVKILVKAPTMASIKTFLNGISIIFKDNRDRKIIHKCMKYVKNYTKEVQKSLQNISEIGSKRIKDGDVVLLYSFSNTVIEMLKSAIIKGVKLEIIITEGHPTSELSGMINFLKSNNLSYTLITDMSAGYFMPRVNKVFIGADCITYQGEVINKTGTYLVALAANDKKVPFIVAATTQKFDPISKWAYSPKIRLMKIKLNNNHDTSMIDFPLFDITPKKYITEIITDKGIITPYMAHTITDDIEKNSLFIKWWKKALKELK